jgi:hypothetical protein
MDTPPTRHRLRTECHHCDGHGFLTQPYATLLGDHLDTLRTTRPCPQPHFEDGWLPGFVPPL